MFVETYCEQARELPVKAFDVVVAGGGTAGVVAAIAAARHGARTALIEAKGYPGGIVVEGGTALHSYYNLWKAFPGVAKRQVVKGIPQEIVDRLAAVGGTSGHAEMLKGYDYDSICTAIDTEIYKGFNCHPFTLTNKTEQNMFRQELVMIEFFRFLLSKYVNNSLGSFC